VAELDPKVGQLPTVDENSGRPPAPPVFVCHRDPVAFDLSQLRPTWSTPAAFYYAWVYANREREVPGFVVTYTGTYSGPVQASVGAVYPSSPGTYSFMLGLHNTPPVLATIDADRFHVKSYSDDAEFVTAFGTVQNREGFRVSKIAIDGHLDSECRFLRNVVVDMWLPASNVGQHFGNQTIDEELGSMIELDPVTKSKGWVVTMTAPVLEAMRFRL
jgi:hypothetical protein